MFISLTSLATAVTTLCLGIGVIVLYFKYSFGYWKRKGIQVLEPSIPGGNIGECLIGKKSIGEIVWHLYDYFKSKGCKHGGLYFISSPVYMPLDHEVIKNILIKDSYNFMDRGVHYDEVNEPISAHLFALAGMKWKNLRAKLTPTFTSGKMKMMFQTVTECSDILRQECDKYANKNIAMDIKDLSARYTTDVIGSCAFGLDCNSLKDPRASEFRKMAQKFFEPNTWDGAKLFIAFGYPGLMKFLGLKVINAEVSDFFRSTVEHTINYREKNNIQRNDFLQLLMQLKNKGKLDDDENDKDKGEAITMDEAAAQAFVIFLGGSDTSSTGMSCCLLELARNLELQDKLREEVKRVMKEHGGVTYEAINQMKYMDMVISETLRKYPPVMVLIRKCLADYNIEHLNFTLNKGTMVYVPTLGIHRDPEFYPDPDKFDPERFSEENKAKRHVSTFLPFGEGPRVCIGLRFGMMQMKIGLAILINNYHFSINSKTEYPIKFNENSFVLIAKGGIWLDIKTVNN